MLNDRGKEKSVYASGTGILYEMKEILKKSL